MVNFRVIVCGKKNKKVRNTEFLGSALQKWICQDVNNLNSLEQERMTKDRQIHNEYTERIENKTYKFNLGFFILF